MEYEVMLTAQAIGQIEESLQYISKILLEPGIARKWLNTLQCEIGKLGSMPSRYPLTEEEPWHTKGVRRMPVKNFLVYYQIKEEKKAVWVVAVIYGRRDQIAALLDMSSSGTEFSNDRALLG